MKIVAKNNKYNIILPNGQYMFHLDYDYISKFSSVGIAVVALQGKYSYINKEGTNISGWFDYADEFINIMGHWYGKVYKHDYVNYSKYSIFNSKTNIIDVSGNILSFYWFDYIGTFDSFGYAIVCKNNKYNIININGNLVLNTWMTSITKLNYKISNIYIVDHDDLYYRIFIIINKNKPIIYKIYSNILLSREINSDNLFMVYNSVTCTHNYIKCIDGNLLLNNWIKDDDNISFSFKHSMKNTIKIKNNLYVVDNNGNFIHTHNI